jgi:thioesterase domain-containing protein
VLGWDLGAALAMAQALGIPALVAAEFLPLIEAVMVGKINEQAETARGDWDLTP